MVKDKLEKTGHKKMYYISRRVGIVAGACLALGVIVAVPTSIKFANVVESKLDAETSNKISDYSVNKGILHYATK